MALVLPFIEDDFFLPDSWAVDVSPRKRRSPLDDILDIVDWTPMRRRRIDLEPRIEMTKDKFNVNLNVRGYKPEELTVQVDDQSLILSGRHEEKSEDGSRCSAREFKRVISLPKEVDVEKLKSCLAIDGRTLKIEAPIKAIEPPKEQPKEIPIQVTKVTNSNPRSVEATSARSG